MRRRAVLRAGLVAALTLGGSLAAGTVAPLRDLAGVLAVATSPLRAVQFRATRVDWVERELRGGPAPVYTTFTTVFQVGGRTVPAAVFWRTVRAGDVIQAKVARRAGLLWAARVNVKAPAVRKLP